jgi:hypothetical protein
MLNNLDYRIQNGTVNISTDQWGQLIMDLMEIKQSAK